MLDYDIIKTLLKQGDTKVGGQAPGGGVCSQGWCRDCIPFVVTERGFAKPLLPGWGLKAFARGNARNTRIEQNDPDLSLCCEQKATGCCGACRKASTCR